ncbi:MAG: hypothetical protein KY468_18370 [Armatimonadetes bacterium]|nr:hypothetical protein [Armatimonadota bacterium]
MPFALLLLALPTAQGEELYPAPLTTGEPGGTVTLPIYLSGARQLTVGSFRVTLTAASGLPLPKILALQPGAALAAAGTGCEPCRSLPAFPLKSRSVSDQEAEGLFFLPSGAPLQTTDGLNGDALEIARVSVSLPPSVPQGTAYEVVLTEGEFSDARSESVTVTTKAGVIRVVPPVALKEGPNTAYHDPGQSGPLLVPTSGDDLATPSVESGFPNDGRTVGNRSYAFRVEAAGIGDSPLIWSVSATTLDGASAPKELLGTVEAGNADGTLGIYTPAEASMRMMTALRIAVTARHSRDESKALTISALLLPYGDANLDGRVTGEDADLAFRWANGLNLPFAPAPLDSPHLIGLAPSPVRRLLADVRGVPGTELSGDMVAAWTDELRRLNLPDLPRLEMTRDGFPFGDGRVTHADVQWIARKAALNTSAPAMTLDPRRNGATPVPLSP